MAGPECTILHSVADTKRTSSDEREREGAGGEPHLFPLSDNVTELKIELSFNCTIFRRHTSLAVRIIAKLSSLIINIQ